MALTPRLLVFDLDGTLIDSRLDLTNSVNAMLVQFGRATLPEAVVGSYIGDGAQCAGATRTGACGLFAARG